MQFLLAYFTFAVDICGKSVNNIPKNQFSSVQFMSSCSVVSDSFRCLFKIYCKSNNVEIRPKGEKTLSIIFQNRQIYLFIQANSVFV